MKKIVVLLVFLCQVFTGLNQTLTLKDLQYVCSQSDWTKVNNYLTNKGWEYYESEKGSSDRYNIITWSFNRGYGGKASGWFYLYTFDGLSNKVRYSVFNQDSYNKVQNQINSLGYKLNESEIEDNEIISTYKNSRYFLKLTTEKRESSGSYYNDGGITAYNFVLILKSGIYDPDNGKKYEYYWDGKTIKIEYNLKDGELEGEFIKYYYNGNIELRSNIKNGKTSGLVERYYNDGKLKSKYHEYDEELHGSYKSYYANGKLQKTGNYYKGLENGLFKEYNEEGVLLLEYNAKNGKLHGEIKVYHNNTNLKREGHMNNGKEHGVFKEYSEEGVLELLYTKKNGEYNGAFKVYYENGRLERQGVFVNGEESGEFKEYNEEGVLEFSYSKKNGEFDGPFKVFYDNGHLKRQGAFLNGEESGEFKEFNEEGELLFHYFQKGAELNGFYKEYENNKLKIDCNYSNGELHGSYIRNYFKNDGEIEYRLSGQYEFGDEDGLWIEQINEDGNFRTIESKTYQKGKLNGPCMLIQGDTLLFCNYSFDKLNGDYAAYYDLKSALFDKIIETDTSKLILLKEGVYFQDQKHGFWKYYYNTGGIREKGTFQYNQKHGNWSYYLPGMTIPVEGGGFMDLPGRLSQTMQYRNGKLNGVVEIFCYLDSKPCAGGEDPDCFNEVVVNRYAKVTYLNDVLHGFAIFKDEDGIVTEKGSYYNGKKSGKWLESMVLEDNDAYVFFSGEYEKGKRNGKWITYFKEGGVILESNYFEDKLHGKTILFNDKGLKSQVYHFTSNTINSVIIYDTEFNEKICMYTFEKKSDGKSLITRIDYEYDYPLFQRQYSITYNIEGQIPFEFHDEFEGFLGNRKSLVQGYEDGTYILYDKKGRVKLTGVTFKGKKIGEWKEYHYEQDVLVIGNYENNQLKSEMYILINNQENFTGKFYLHNLEDAYKIEINVKDGVRHGKTKYLGKDGKLIKKMKYKNGVKI